MTYLSENINARAINGKTHMSISVYFKLSPISTTVVPINQSVILYECYFYKTNSINRLHKSVKIKQNLITKILKAIYIFVY